MQTTTSCNVTAASSKGSAAKESPFADFTSLRALIENTHRALWRFPELDCHVRTLRDTIYGLDVDPQVSEAFVAGLPSHLVALQQLAYCRWETWIESRFVQGWNYAMGLDQFPLTPRYHRTIDRELDLLAPAPVKRALFIGSGPMPISAIILQQRTGADVDCVDNDPVAVVQSRELIERLGLVGRIDVRQADGTSVDASGYDTIIVALLAKPKATILARLAETVSETCRVVCRTTRGLRVLLYESLEPDRDLAGYRVVHERLALRAGDTVSSLLLMRA